MTTVQPYTLRDITRPAARLCLAVLMAAGAAAPVRAYWVHLQGCCWVPGEFGSMVMPDWIARQLPLVAVCLTLAVWFARDAVRDLRGTYTPPAPLPSVRRAVYAAFAVVALAYTAVPAEAYWYFAHMYGHGDLLGYAFANGLGPALKNTVLVLACLVFAARLLVRARPRPSR